MNNRVCVVVGASSGIGAATCTKILETGNIVAGISRRGSAPEGALGVSADVTDIDQIDRALTKIKHDLGDIQVLVYAAGITIPALLGETSELDWQKQLDVNLTGAFNAIKLSLRSMITTGWGRIVVVGSVVGAHGRTGLGAYGATKAALAGMVRSLAVELAANGITVNLVAPGFVDTAMTAQLSDTERTAIMAQIPMGRFARPAEVASLINYLISEDAGYITGATIPVAGGLGIGL